MASYPVENASGRIPMRSVAHRLFFAAIVFALMVWSIHHLRTVASAQERTPASITRIFTGSDGQTHAEQVNLKFAPHPRFARDQSELIKATSAYVARFPPGFFQDWHPAGERRYVITLSGRGEIELAGGQKIVLEPGRILQAEDLTGKGHITRTLGKEDWTAFFVQYDQ